MGTAAIFIAILKIFLMILPGLLFARLKLIDARQLDGVTAILLNLTFPCMAIDALQMPFSGEILRSCGNLMAALCGVLALSLLMSVLLGRLCRLNYGRMCLFTFMLTIPNTGFIGIPAARALYGDEGAFYAALLDAAMNLVIFTVGTALMVRAGGGREFRLRLRDLATPTLFAVLLGIVLFLADIRLPELIGGPVASIGSATTPLAMFVIGYLLGGMNLKELFRPGREYVLVAARLILVPVLLLGAARLFFPGAGLAAKIVILLFAMPAATCSVILTQQYRGDVPFSSRGTILSTLLGAATLPLIVVLMEALL